MDFVVEDRLVTDVGGTIGIRVLSTPGMIGDDGAELGDPLLRAPAGRQGHRRLRGLRQARRGGGGGGRPAPVSAKLSEVVDGRKLRFDVEVREGERTIGVGTPRAPGDRRRRREVPVARQGGFRALPSLRLVPALPSTVRIREVGPRDGFQNEPEVIPTADKVRLIGMLGAHGAAADRAHLVRAPGRDPAARRRRARCSPRSSAPTGVAYSVLIPNERGLERALAQRERFDEINVFLSASETHNAQERQPHDRRVARRARAGDRRAPATRDCAARA